MEDRRALAGTRVLELTVAVAAPSCGRYLAYHGAEVIKIESRANPDIARLFGSAWARTEELAPVFQDTSPYLPEMTAGKLSLGLELKHPDALAAARRLVAASDVFLTNLTAPAVRGLGLTYEELRAVRPDIVYAAMPAFGTTEGTPYYEFRGYGPNQAPLVGLDELTGYADQEPAGIATFAPPDYVAGMHAALAILSGLEQRDETGESCFLDISQLETTVAFLGPYLIDRGRGGPAPERNGNRLPWQAPCGTYPCVGDDSYVAITVDSDDAWRRLGEAAGSPGWAADERFATLAGRVDHHDEIDVAIAGWTSGLTARDAAARLQRVGVAAYPVLDHLGVFLDPQVQDRRWFDVKPCSRFGHDLFSGHPLRLHGSPPYVERAGPSAGEDTRAVLGGIGYDDAEIDRLIECGAAFTEAQPETVVRRPFADWFETFDLIDTAEPAGAAEEG